MDVRLDDAQLELQRVVGRFLADRFPLDRIAEREGATVDRSVWSELAELGILGLLLPESAGGSGMGAVEATIVFELVGSQLVTGPVRWSVMAAGLVDGAHTGDTIVGGAVGESLDGVIVEHAADLDVLLAVGPGGVTAHPRSGRTRPVALDPLDPLTPVGRIDDVGPGAVVGDSAIAARMTTLGRLLGAAEATGVSARALEVARTYALEREQFGVPIGSFQAIKHMLADMYLRTELAQSATYAAAAMLDAHDTAAADRAVAAAKLLAGDAALANASASVQILGGMGFTWDMLPNYLVKRAWVLEQSFGTADELAELVGSSVGAER